MGKAKDAGFFMRKRKVPRIIHYFNAVQSYLPDLPSNEVFLCAARLSSNSFREAEFLMQDFLDNLTEEKIILAKKIPPIVLEKSYEFLIHSGRLK